MRPITVVEMDDVERAELVEYLSYHPTAGVVIQGTGGVHKLRWGLEGRGKRGGARVIYYFHDMDMPLYVMTAYAKNERENLSQAESKTLQKLARMIVEMNQKRRPSL